MSLFFAYLTDIEINFLQIGNLISLLANDLSFVFCQLSNTGYRKKYYKYKANLQILTRLSIRRHAARIVCIMTTFAKWSSKYANANSWTPISSFLSEKQYQLDTDKIRKLKKKD